MKHRIAAGVLLEHEGKVLLVRHRKVGAYDFWVAPGGGAEGVEDLRSTARREVLEECGLVVEPQTVAYIEEFNSPYQRECKVWFTARLVGGKLNTSAAEAAREHIVEAAFLSRSDFEGKVVFPPMLQREYWEDKNLRLCFPQVHRPSGNGVLLMPRHPRSNPSVKGTACGKPQAAPYVER